MNVLLSLLKTSPEYEQLCLLAESGQTAAVSGVSQIARAHWIAALHEDTGRPVVAVCQDDMAADRLRTELAAFLGAQPAVLPGRELTFLDAAGISRKQVWRRLDVPCSYRLMERMKQELEAQGGQVLDIDYGAEVTIHALLPKSDTEACAARLVDVSNGTVTPLPGDEAYQAFPVRAPRQPEE